MHGDFVSGLGVLAVGLDGHLGRVRGADQGVCVHAPVGLGHVVLVDVVGDGLDEVALGSAHANPEGGDASAGGGLGEYEGRRGFADP